MTTALSPKQIALDHIAQNTAPATGVVEYQSTGRILLLVDAHSQSQSKAATALFTDAKAINVVNIDNKSAELNGYLGHFELTLSDTLQVKHNLEADIVLDFTTNALIQREILPPGYYALSDIPTSETIAEIESLNGTFHKPKYFSYNESICAHSRSGLSGCNNCIEACPADAIISYGEKIQVDTKLCQGGGSCATACPTGAIQYAYPSPDFSLNQLRSLLKHYAASGGSNPHILFYRAEADIDLTELDDNILPIACEELASVGAEQWLSALSYGAKQVLLYDDEATPASARDLIKVQLHIAQVQLGAMGYAEQSIQRIQALSDIQPITMSDITPATHAATGNKRQHWFMAVDHLFAQATTPADDVLLPTGSPFGQVVVDKNACTMCMACVTVCPAAALSGGTTHPELKFYANNCVQCGLCQQGCPEQAISLKPLYVFDAAIRRQTQQLNEEAAFLCISCSKPFASQSMITTMLDKLSSHPMFQNERATQRLKMCEDCRVVDIVQDADAMGDTAMHKPNS